MDYIKQFYKELEEGVSPNDLSKKIQSCLNEAITRKDDECKNKKKFEKDAEAVAEVLNSFISTYYPDTKINYTTDDIIKSCNFAAKKPASMSDLIDYISTSLF